MSFFHLSRINRSAKMAVDAGKVVKFSKPGKLLKIKGGKFGPVTKIPPDGPFRDEHSESLSLPAACLESSIISSVSYLVSRPALDMI